MTHHYLDHASTSPLRPEVATAIAAILTGVLGDPGRIHYKGMDAALAAVPGILGGLRALR